MKPTISHLWTIILMLLLPTVSRAIDEKRDFISSRTGDTYSLIIRKPENFDTSKYYHIVIFTDATINSGKTILSQSKESTSNCILIGIGHQGDWHSKRQRDLIPSDAGGHQDKEFGQAARFFLLMQNELVPYINKRFGKQRSRIFIGHSFGGLFALYMSLRNNKLFDHYYAISPSVWANYGELMKIENSYAKQNRKYESSISIYAGSLEVFNKVLSSSRDFYETVLKRKYEGLTITYDVISWVNHYGIVPKVIPGILEELNHSS